MAWKTKPTTTPNTQPNFVWLTSRPTNLGQYVNILSGKVKVPPENEDLEDDIENLKACSNNEKSYTDLVLSMEDKACFSYVDGTKSTMLLGVDAVLVSYTAICTLCMS